MTARFEWEEDAYVATCVELGIGTQGKTLDEAEGNLAEALELYLEVLAERGKLEKELADRSVRIQTEDEMILRPDKPLSIPSSRAGRASIKDRRTQHLSPRSARTNYRVPVYA